jgi:hypothetical protein
MGNMVRSIFNFYSISRQVYDLTLMFDLSSNDKTHASALSAPVRETRASECPVRRVRCLHNLIYPRRPQSRQLRVHCVPGAEKGHSDDVDVRRRNKDTASALNGHIQPVGHAAVRRGYQ